MENLKVIEWGNCWKCDNLDNLAPITKEGVQCLLSDNSIITIWNDEKRELSFEIASDSEKVEFYQKRGHLFKGQAVEIICGRTLPKGEVKIINSFYRYNITGTYGHGFIDYVVFNDGSKINLKYVKPTCQLFDNVKTFKEHQPLYMGGRL